MEKNLIAFCKEYSKKYLGSHQETAKEAFADGITYASQRSREIISQLETALEACNEERKKYRDELDSSNAEYSKLKKEYESLLGASSLLL